MPFRGGFSRKISIKNWYFIFKMTGQSNQFWLLVSALKILKVAEDRLSTNWSTILKKSWVHPPCWKLYSTFIFYRNLCSYYVFVAPWKIKVHLALRLMVFISISYVSCKIKWFLQKENVLHYEITIVTWSCHLKDGIALLPSPQAFSQV